MEGRPECESGRGRSMGRLRYLYGRKALNLRWWGRSMGRLRYLYGRKA